MSRGKRRICIAGGSGFIGTLITAEFLRQGDEVTILSRSPKPPAPGMKTVPWTYDPSGNWVRVLEKCDVLINLCGSTILGKWDPAQRQRILSSRLEPTRVLGYALGNCTQKPKIWINMSATGIYGNRGEVLLSENATTCTDSDDFLADVCQKWETTAHEACPSGVHLSIARCGVVLGTEGGTYKTLANLTKYLLGGTIGRGTQYVPWIHGHDLARLFVHFSATPQAITFNAVAPNSATMSEMMTNFRSALKRPFGLPTPEFLVSFGHKLGGPAPSMLLASQRVVPEVALKSGFQFQFPDIESAIRDLSSRY